MLFCRVCNDIVCLRKSPRTCECGQSGGYYEEDGLHVVVNGPSRVIGFSNSHFNVARYNDGFDFNSSFVSEDCPLVKRVSEDAILSDLTSKDLKELCDDPPPP